MLRTSYAVLFAFVVASSAWPQEVLSLKSGLVHHIEGEVLLDGAAVKVQVGRFPSVKEGQTLSTKIGRAEVLLNPGVFLRMADSSGLRMMDSSLANTRVELTSGVALLEAAELDKDNRVTVKTGVIDVALDRAGLYLFDSEKGLVRVYEGRARLSTPEGQLTLVKGREYRTGGDLTAVKFPGSEKQKSALYRWSLLRSNTVAKANVSTADTFKKTGFRMGTSGWAWHPYLGMITFMPRGGYIRSPFGCTYYSPSTIWMYYSPAQSSDYYDHTADSNGRSGGQWSGMGADSGSYRSSAGSSPQPAYTQSAGAVRAAAPAAAPAQASPSGARGR